MPGSRRARNGTALALCLAVATGVAAQFRSGIEKVVVTVTVTDSNGRLITGLSRDDFEVFEDGDPQPVTQFTDARLPVSLGILLDVSDSMRGQAIVDARRALDRFVGVLLEPGDEVFVQVFQPRATPRRAVDPASVWARVTARHALADRRHGHVRRTGDIRAVAREPSARAGRAGGHLRRSRHGERSHDPASPRRAATRGRLCVCHRA